MKELDIEGTYGIHWRVRNLCKVSVEKVKVKRICKGIESESADWISEFE